MECADLHKASAAFRRDAGASHIDFCERRDFQQIIYTDIRDPDVVLEIQRTQLLESRHQFDPSIGDICAVERQHLPYSTIRQMLNSNIRYLAVRNVNAVKTQLAIAVLVQLLLQLKKIIESFQGTLRELLRIIRTTMIRKSLSQSQSPDDCRWKTKPIEEMAL